MATIPLGEHLMAIIQAQGRRFDEALGASDARIHELIASLRAESQMRSEFFLAELRRMDEKREAEHRRNQEWREIVNTRLDNIESAGRTRAALLATGLVVLGLALAIIQFLRGPF